MTLDDRKVYIYSSVSGLRQEETCEPEFRKMRSMNASSLKRHLGDLSDSEVDTLLRRRIESLATRITQRMALEVTS